MIKLLKEPNGQSIATTYRQHISIVSLVEGEHVAIVNGHALNDAGIAMPDSSRPTVVGPLQDKGMAAWKGRITVR